jgi:hypothetical protein
MRIQRINTWFFIIIMNKSQLHLYSYRVYSIFDHKN